MLCFYPHGGLACREGCIEPLVNKHSDCRSRTWGGGHFEGGIRAQACSCHVPSRTRVSMFGRFSISVFLQEQGFPSDVFYKYVKMPAAFCVFLIRETFRIRALPLLKIKYFGLK